MEVSDLTAPDGQEHVRAGVARLAEAYLTGGIRDRLSAESRIRLTVAQHGTREQVADLRLDAERGAPPTVVEDERWYVAYPGCRGVGCAGGHVLRRDGGPAPVGGQGRLRLVCRPGQVRSEEITIAVRATRPDRLAPLWTRRLGCVRGWWTARIVSFSFLVTDLAREGGGHHVRSAAASSALGSSEVGWPAADAVGANRDAPVRAPNFGGPRRSLHVCAHGLYRAILTKNNRGQLVIHVARIGPRMVMSRLRRGLK